MKFLFSNRRLWYSCYTILISISVAFIVLAFLSYRSLPLLLISLGFSMASGVYSLRFLKLYSNYYLIFDREGFEIYSMLTNKKNYHNYSDVKLLVKRGTVLDFQLENGEKTRIHLEYLNADDVAKLILYLKFHPAIKAEKKSFL